jgi:nickel/cobalt transporter (NicO) family protein
VINQVFKPATFIVIFMLSASTLSWAANPFLSGNKKEVTVKKQSLILKVFQPALNISHQFQKQLKIKLTTFARDMRKEPWGKSFWLFLLFSFLYGIFHAIGPGHGKSIAMSYFLSRPGSIVQGFLMGNILTFVHVASAVVVIIVLYFIFKVTGIAQFDELTNTFKIVSYGLLLAVGVYLAGKAISEVKHWQNLDKQSFQETPDMKSLVLTSLVTGLIPCPGAAIILSFSIIMKVMAQGLLAMVFIALGMGLTTSSLALTTILSRKTLMHFIDKRSRLFIWIYLGMAFSGALAIILISSLLLVESIGY